MDFIKNYLFGIVTASIICAIATYAAGKKSTHSKLIRLICGLFLTISAISPFVKIRISDITQYIEQIEISADDAVAYGQYLADTQMTTIIKSDTEAYILDKASSLGLTINVEVTVSDSSPKRPYKVTLSGTAAPLKKRELQDWIYKDLDIAEENLKWI